MREGERERGREREREREGERGRERGREREGERGRVYILSTDRTSHPKNLSHVELTPQRKDVNTNRKVCNYHAYCSRFAKAILQ